MLCHFCNPYDISDMNDEHTSGIMKQGSDLQTDLTDGSSSDTDAVEMCDKLKALPAISQPKESKPSCIRMNC